MDEEMVIENNNAFLMAMGEGSRIEIHGADAAKESWTNLAESAAAGSNQLVVQESTGWEVGDRIAVSSTSSNRTHDQEFTITAISDDGKTITVDAPLETAKSGETIHYNNGQTGDDYREWNVEERAEVALLSRNVTIQGDEDSVEDGFGGHTMVMEGASQHLSGVEFFRMGQEDILGRYPVHWHLLGDAAGQYAEGISVHHSYQKGTTIHGSSNIRLEDSVIFDHVGHGVFLEDGSELGTQIIGNLVFGTHASETGLPIITDQNQVASYWIENPSTILIGNVAGGSDENGFMIFPANQVHGASLALGMTDAGDMADLIFQNNVAHSNVNFGLSIEGSIDPETLAVNHGGTQQGDFATIDGFLAYNNIRHGAWTFTHNTIIEDSMFVDNNFGGILAKGGTYFQDTLFAENRVGSYNYTQANVQYDGVHFEDTTIFTNNSTTIGANTLKNVTHSGDDLTITTLISEALGSQADFLDVDGSVTGIPGAFLTYEGTNAAMAAAPGATFDEGLGFWVSEATVGVTLFYTPDNTETLRILRSDGVEVTGYTSFRDRYFDLKNAAGMERDVAYLLDYSGELSGNFRINTTQLLDGQSVVYEIPNVASVTGVDGATEVNSLNALLTADASAYLVQGGSLFVRAVVADDTPTDRPIDDLLEQYDATANLLIRGIEEVNQPDNNPAMSAALINAINAVPARELNITPPEPVEAALDSYNDTFELERHASTSDTTVVTAEMARWSEGSSWDGTAPGVDDIVVIGPGEIVVLDESITVKGIIVNGGELIVEDGADLTIDLATDYLLVINGGLFQAGTEADPL
ncbi:MAG: G8 domain-containing protein, partial [Pseudomonadota bacterium]